MIRKQKTEKPEGVRTAKFCLNIVGCMCWVTAAFFMFILVSGVKIAGGDGGRLGLARTMLPKVDGLSLFFVFAFAGLLAFIIAPGLTRARGWSRWAAIALSVVLLPLFPFGTVPAIFILFGLLNGKAKAWFKAGPSQNRPSPSSGSFKQTPGGA